MDLSRLLAHIAYRIEPKPEGGFIARPSNPTVPELEASTREELRQKMRANMTNALITEFPHLSGPLENKSSDVSAFGSSPITPESGSGSFFRLLLALLVIALLTYFFLHHR